MRTIIVPSESTLTLFIPDLFGFQSTFSKLSLDEKSQLSDIKLPVLEKWLSRGLFEKSSDQVARIFSELGLNKYKNKDKPYAVFSLLAEKNPEIELSTDAYWFRADPVNLQADRDTAILAGHEDLNLSQDEADKLVALINEHFVDEPWQLYTCSPHRWYMRLDKPSSLKTTPLDNVLGEDINLFNPTGNDADYWFKIMNELQMLIHGSNVNFERESRNKMTANSLWLWGGGCLPDSKMNPYYDKIITNNIIFSGIGYHCGFDVLPLDDTFVEKIKSNNNVIVLDMLSEQCQRRDAYTFMQKLNELENTFLIYCNDLLLGGHIGKIKLISDAGTYTINKKQLGRWWERTKSFLNFNYA